MADGEHPFLEHPPFMATKLHPSDASRPSYAAVLQNKKQNEDAKEPNSSNLVQLEDVSFKPVSQYQGKLAVIFPILEKSMLVDKLKFVLIGKFSHGRPPWSKIKAFFVDLKLNGTFNISVFDQKHIYIECSNQIDYNRIWLRLNWKVDGCSMRILKWVPQFTPMIESPIVPVWIRLEGIPLYMFEEMPLLQISNAMGKPIKIDARNLNRSMLNIARVCVELDISKPLIDSFWVCFEDKEKGVVKEPFEVEVFYDSLPDYCSICSHIGHKMEDCKRKISTSKVHDVSHSNVERNKVFKMLPTQTQKVTRTWMAVTPEPAILDKGKGIMQVEAKYTMVGEVQLVDEPKNDVKDAVTCEIQGTAMPQFKQLQQTLVEDGKVGTAISNSFSLIGNMSEEMAEPFPVVKEIKQTKNREGAEERKDADAAASNQNYNHKNNIDANLEFTTNAIVTWEEQEAEEKKTESEAVPAAMIETACMLPVALNDQSPTDFAAAIKDAGSIDVVVREELSVKAGSNSKDSATLKTGHKITSSGQIMQPESRSNTLSWADECSTQADEEENEHWKIVTRIGEEQHRQEDSRDIENGRIKLIPAHELDATQQNGSMFKIYKNTLSFYIHDLHSQDLEQQENNAELVMIKLYRRHLNLAIEEAIKKDIVKKADEPHQEQEWQTVSSKKKRNDTKQKQVLDQEKVVIKAPKDNDTKHKQDIDSRMASLWARINRMRRDSPAKRKLQEELKALSGTLG